MTNLTKRGNVYHYQSTVGGNRLRCSLGVSDPKSASRLENRVTFALADGPKSAIWPELKAALPKTGFDILTKNLNLPADSPDLLEFEQSFLKDLSRRADLSDIAASTAEMYGRICGTFFDRMVEIGVQKIDELTAQTMADYFVWRKKSILAKNPDKGARGLETESRILKEMFNFAEKSGLPAPQFDPYKSPVAADEPDPFSADDLEKMNSVAEETERLVYLIFRWTGLRRSDVADLTWGAIEWGKSVLSCVTKKRKVMVHVPMAPVLVDALKDVYSGQPASENILVGLTKNMLYSIIKGLGEKAGVENCHPHRFRHTFAINILERGGSIYDVAKILGNQTSTVEKYYGKFTDQAQERVRTMLSK